MDNKPKKKCSNPYLQKKRIILSLLLFIFSVTIFINSCISQETQIPRWRPHDFNFKSKSNHENPFTVDFSAAVKGPDGTEFTTLGFYNGNKTWEIRVAPNVEGPWVLETHSNDPQLDGKTASFMCIPNDNPNIHGKLLVDPEHPHHFIFEDGSRYFLMGYECDWLWALDMEEKNLPTLNPFLDRLASHGFNHIILNAYAHDTKWRKGNTEDGDYGPPPMFAWEGSNENPVHNRFNLSYWEHYDRVMNALYQRGIMAHIMIKVYNKFVNWPKIGSKEDDLYFRWIIARYAAYPNAVWDFSKEAHNEKGIDYKLNRLRLIREHDPYHNLITVHDDNQLYDNGTYSDILDFRSDQHHNKWHPKILEQRTQNIWPVVNVEFGYEHGPQGLNDKTYNVVQSPKEVCRRGWEICLAGGYIAYYYTYTAWDIIRPEDIPEGYAYFEHLHEFFENTNYWLMKPSDELVSEGYCISNRGKEYIVFLNNAKPFTLKIEGANSQLKSEWYHPFTGEKADAGKVTNGTVKLTPPQEWGDIPIALHVFSAPKD